MAIRVLIAEDYTALRADLRTLICAEPDIAVVGEADHLAEVCQLARTLRPDVILLDIGLPDLHGFDAIFQLRCTIPSAQILLLVNSEDVGLMHDALVAGAAGCVVSQTADTCLGAAIRVVSQGRLYIRPNMLQTLLTSLDRQPDC